MPIWDHYKFGSAMGIDIQLLNEKDVAALCNCSVAALRKWKLLGTGPAFVKIGRLRRYRLADVEAWIEQHRHEPARKAA